VNPNVLNNLENSSNLAAFSKLFKCP